MFREGVYDLSAAKPHEPEGQFRTAEEFRHYHAGYYYALVMVLRVMDAAERRFDTIRRTKRLEAKRRREQT